MSVQYVKVNGRWSPVSSDEPVDAVESVADVDAVALVDEDGTEVEEFAEGEPGADALDEDADAFGHEDQG